MNYKFKIAALLSCLSLISAQAQLFPVAGDKQIVFGMNGNSASIQYRKFTTETINNRLGIFANIGINNSVNENNGLKLTQNSSNFSGSIAVGKQKNFFIGEKFSPYVALDASIGVNYFASKGETSLLDSSKYNQSRNYNLRTVSLKSLNEQNRINLNVGLIAAIGFNYYLAKNFAIGAECRLATININYAITGSGKDKQESTTWNTSTNTLIKEPGYNTESKLKSGYSLLGAFNPTIQITAAFYIK